MGTLAASEFRMFDPCHCLLLTPTIGTSNKQQVYRSKFTSTLMKIKFTSGILNVIGLTAVLVSTSAFSLTSNRVHAEQPDSSEPTLILNKPVPSTSAQQFPELAGIELTSQQQKQIWQIRREMQPEFEAILPRPELTPEQQEQINSGKPIRVALPFPTSEQQTKLREVMQVYQQKIEAILTPDQQQQFRQNDKKDVLFFERKRDN